MQQAARLPGCLVKPSGAYRRLARSSELYEANRTRPEILEAFGLVHDIGLRGTRIQLAWSSHDLGPDRSSRR